MSPYITVDECMVAYNGRFCFFKQYLPAKPITHGIKIWAMACSVTSFVYKLEVYVGAKNEPTTNNTAPIGLAGKVVSRLTESLVGHWYTLTCDNYFTSPFLFDYLLSRGIYAVGTARQQRKGYPTSLNIMTELPRGTLQIRVHKSRQMAAIHWQDTKGVHFLSTAADPMIKGGVVTHRISGHARAEVNTSPIQILYSQYMGGVDVGDQLRYYYSTQIATKKWWHRVYFFCLDTCITNAYIMHKGTCARLGVKALNHKDFQMCTAYALMAQPHRVEVISALVPRRPPLARNAAAVVHLPCKTVLRRVCRVCKKRTYWVCEQCDNTRLCTQECFKVFHIPARVAFN